MKSWRTYHVADTIRLVRDFNRNNNSGQKRSFGNKRQFGNRFDMPRPTLHKAICSNCGKDCEIPFKPTNGKPVLCRDCFRGSGEQQVRRPYERSFQNIPSQGNEYKAQLDALTIKIDKILEILEAATSANKISEEVVPELTPKKRKTTKKPL